MTRPRLTGTRWLFAIVASVILAPGLTWAAVRADLDGDGVLDSVRVERSAAAGTRVLLDSSGHPSTRVLASREQVSAVAAADVDRDGQNDLVATSPKHGLIIWRNLGHGRFAKRHRMPALTRPWLPQLLPRGALGAAEDPSDSRNGDELVHGDALFAGRFVAVPASTPDRLVPQNRTAFSWHLDRTRPSRGPPA